MKKLKNIEGNLDGIKVKTPNGVIGYWKSQWNKGVWLSDGKSDRIYPQFVESLEECREWEVVEDEKVNCDILTDMEHIDLIKKYK